MREKAKDWEHKGKAYTSRLYWGFDRQRWGLGIKLEYGDPGLGLDAHREIIFSLSLLCFHVDYSREIFKDEEGILG